MVPSRRTSAGTNHSRTLRTNPITRGPYPAPTTGACGGLRGFGGGARCAVCAVGGSGSRRGVSVLGTA
ncbi:hypothetical protein GTY88_44520, partial [Streptomyces sp. SID5926]|nr:hypothetical protein [Streptomyces sp. SID5926]